MTVITPFQTRAASSGHARTIIARVALKILALVLGVSLGALIAEFAVRFIAPQALVSDIVIGDDDIGYRLRPNAQGRMISPEYSVSIRINSSGFRGPEVYSPKASGMTRVLFLGDSYAFGHGLGEKETLPFLVGQELDGRHPSRYEVINGGVYGYCTANELELLAKYGLGLKPDIVVVLVMIHDMFDNTSWYDLDADGNLRRKVTSSQYVASRRITRYIPGAGWLRENSHLFKFAGVRVLPIVRSGVGQRAKSVRQDETNIDEFSPEFYQQRVGPFKITTALLVKIGEVAKKSGAEVVLLTLGEFRTERPISDLMLPDQQLIGAALSAGFSEGLALTPILATAKDRETLSFPQDGHWTAAATRLVAPAVANVIARVPRGR